jgi:hypothetical protein
MNDYKRNGFKWGINEILSLQREFELLNWSIDEMALKHKRTPNAIMLKLDQEGFADYNVLYSNYYDLNAQMPVHKKETCDLSVEEEEDDEEEYDEEYEACDEDDDDEAEDDEMTVLSDRVNMLEDAVHEIKTMIQNMMNSMFNKQNLQSYP